jgi:pheromone shutdown protein TraB
LKNFKPILIHRKEDIEQLKRSDLLDALLKEFGSNFPEFKKVLIDERDMYLTYSLRNACQTIPNEFMPGGKIKIIFYLLFNYHK